MKEAAKNNRTFNDYGGSKKPNCEIFRMDLRFSYHWGSLFTYYFNDIFSAYSVLFNVPIDRKKFIDKLKDEYDF